MREQEIAILIDALRPYCADLTEAELAQAAERFLEYIDLTVEFYARHYSDSALTESDTRVTVESDPSLPTQTSFPLP